MNKTKIILLLAFVIPMLFSFQCNESKNKETKSENITASKQKKDSTKTTLTGLQKLLKAYPNFLDKADGNKLYWKDGATMIYDDGKEKTHEEKLENADIEDMISQEYVMGAKWSEPPAKNFEPGRIRYEPFFEKMYGNSQSAVTSNLTTINWFGTSVQVSTINEVDKKFKAVMEDLEKLLEKYHKYFKKTAGTFNYRKIFGTDRYNAHAFGIAIDINTEYSDYWQWDKSMKYKNRIPFEVAEVFEKHGFIWGAKWYHYDTMHSEYRPELLFN
jgi:hypothetical protein